MIATSSSSANRAELPERLQDNIEKKSHANLPVRTLEIAGIVIKCREDGCVDATALCQAGNKLFADWFKIKRTKELLTAISIDMKICISELIRFGRGELHEHTYVHRRIAYCIAMWISPDFYSRVIRWLDELLSTGSVTLNKEKSNAEIEASYMNTINQLKLKLEQADQKQLQLTQSLSTYKTDHFWDSVEEEIEHFTKASACIDLKLAYLRSMYVVYVIEIPEFRNVNNKQVRVFEFGFSGDIKRRYKEHNKIYPGCRLLHLQIVNHGSQAEQLVKQYLEDNELRTNFIRSNGSKDTETFVPKPNFPLSKIIGHINSMCLKCTPITLTEFYISNIERDIAEHEKELKEYKNENDELRAQLTQLSRECAAAEAKAGAYETLLNKKLNTVIVATTADYSTQTDIDIDVEYETKSAQTEDDTAESSIGDAADENANQDIEEAEESASDSENPDGSGGFDELNESNDSDNEEKNKGDEIDECEEEESKEPATVAAPPPALAAYRKSAHRKHPPVIKRCENCKNDNREFYKASAKLCNICRSEQAKAKRRLENPKKYEVRDANARKQETGKRVCPRCKNTKLVSQFHNSKTASWCKTCQNELRHKNYLKARAHIQNQPRKAIPVIYVLDEIKSSIYPSITKLSKAIGISTPKIREILDTGREYQKYVFMSPPAQQH